MKAPKNCEKSNWMHCEDELWNYMFYLGELNQRRMTKIFFKVKEYSYRKRLEELGKTISMGRVFANCPGDRGFNPLLSHTKDSKKKWYLIPPCLTFSIIWYVSKVKWSNLGKGVVPSSTARCCSYWKRAFGSPSSTVGKFTYFNRKRMRSDLIKTFKIIHGIFNGWHYFYILLKLKIYCQDRFQKLVYWRIWLVC